MDASSGRVKAGRWIGLLLGLLTFAVLLGTAADYGLTSDEPVYTSRAFRAGQWLNLAFTDPGSMFDRAVIDRLWDATGDEQAGLPKLIGYPATMLVSPFASPLAAIRAGTILTVSLLIGLLYIWVARVYGRPEALFASLGLLTLPRVFAHCHLFALDAPVMAWSGLAVICAYNAAVNGPERRKRCWLWIALLGLAFGAAIATKVNGWFIPFIVLPWLFIVRRRAFYAGLVSMAILGPLVFFLSWPWLWHDTAARVARYFSFFFKHYPVGVMYFGKTYALAPWHFAPVMLLITTPILILLLGAVGVFRTTRSAGVSPASVTAPLPEAGETPALRGWWQRAAGYLMLWALLVNIGPSCLPSSPKYNGVRLFLPVFVPLIILAASGFGFLARKGVAALAKSPREARLLMALCLAAALAPGAWSTANSHPYGMSYYNLLIGGTGGAQARGMEVTYWGDAFYAAVPYLNEKAPQGAKVWISVPGFVSTMQMYQTFGLLRPDLQLTGGDEAFYKADLYVVMNKLTEMGDLAKGIVARENVLYVREVGGAPIVWVLKRPAQAGQ
ncbi:MAG: phospholipid carrier-dependent glycosyltransferase [Armatimonadia bacterium]